MNPYESIQPGQLVSIWYEQGSYKQRWLGTVDRLTKSAIIVRGNGYFSRRTGHALGPRAADMSRCYLEAPHQPQ